MLKEERHLKIVPSGEIEFIDLSRFVETIDPDVMQGILSNRENTVFIDFKSRERLNYFEWLKSIFSAGMKVKIKNEDYTYRHACVDKDLIGIILEVRELENGFYVLIETITGRHFVRPTNLKKI